RSHRVVVADWQQRDVDAGASDELQIEKERGVAGMVERLPVRLYEDAAGRAHIDWIEPGLETRSVVRERQLHATEGEIVTATRIHAVGLCAFGGEVLGDFVVGHNRGVAALRNLEGVTG